MTAKRFHLAALISASLFTVSCGDSGSGPNLSNAPEAREAAPRSQEFDNHIVHFSATTTNLLTPDVAQKYGITRSKTNAMLNVVMLEKTGEPGHTPVAGKVTAQTSNLTGQLKNMTLREVTDGAAIYYIGVVSVSNKEILNFNINAVPSGSGKPLQIKFQQEFFTD